MKKLFKPFQPFNQSLVLLPFKPSPLPSPAAAGEGIGKTEQARPGAMRLNGGAARRLNGLNGWS
jgi:hypothetical protein